MVKAHQIGLFISPVGENNYTRICKSETLTITTNANMVDTKFICDEFASKELSSYAPTINQDLTTIKGEKDYELLFPYFMELRTGEEAKADVIVVYMQEPAQGDDSGKKFKAWEAPKSIISITDFNAVDSKLNFDINFGGTINKGTVDMTTGSPVFEKTV